MSTQRNDPDSPGDPNQETGLWTSDGDAEAVNGDGDLAFGVRDLGAPETAGDITHPVVSLRPYNPDKAREWVRGGLAVGAFGLFAIFALGLAAAVAFGATTWDEVEGMSGTLLPAIVSVVGTTTGFYFGTKAKGDA